MTLAQKKHLECAVCGRTSPPAAFAPEVQQLARNEGWLVGQRGHNSSDLIRTRGWDDYCPDHRGAHEIITCEGVQSGKHLGEPCDNQAVIQLTRGIVNVNSCAFHAWVLEKELLVAERDTVVTVRIIEG